MLESVIVAFHLLTAICIIGLVLVQQGKGADAGASFGAGASATVFGSQGSATFFSKLTALLAAIFFATSLGLAYFAKSKANDIGLLGLPDAVITEEAAIIPTLDEQLPIENNISNDVPVISDDLLVIEETSNNEDNKQE